MTEHLNLPFHREHIREIALELFAQTPQWRTAELVKEISLAHRQRGGTISSDPSYTVRRLLQDLRNEGLIAMVAHGYWNVANGSPKDKTSPIVPVTLPIDEQPKPEPKLPIDKQIGTGTECVYLYYNPNDKKLALSEGKDVWECKIGRTSNADPTSRIIDQGVRTSLSRVPVVGLVIRTDNSSDLERLVHASLRLSDKQLTTSPGNEWFITSPDRIEEWYIGMTNALSFLQPERPNAV